MSEMNNRFLDACRLQEVDRTPMWMMRQAGRYMEEYRALRKRYAMLELCRTPELAAQVTLMPLERFDLDAAILFSDITMPFYGLEVDFDLKPGVGPVISEPIRCAADVKRLKKYDVQEKLPFVLETVRILREQLKVPLIGFAGAPFTLAAYLIEGKPSRDFRLARQFMFCEEAAWHELMSTLAEATLQYLRAQAQAGAQALQVFDSWVGGLHPEVYREFLLPHMQLIFNGLRDLDLPLIHFGTGTACLLPIMKEAGGDVIGVDWRTPMSFAMEVLGEEVGLQGNFDSTLLFASQERIESAVRDLFEELGGRRGHIFNLGHGILPETPVENVSFLIECVHKYG